MSNKKYRTSPHQPERKDGDSVIFANDDGIEAEPTQFCAREVCTGAIESNIDLLHKCLRASLPHDGKLRSLSNSPGAL